MNLLQSWEPDMIRDERLKIKAKMFRGFADRTRLAMLLANKPNTIFITAEDMFPTEAIDRAR